MHFIVWNVFVDGSAKGCSLHRGEQVAELIVASFSCTAKATKHPNRFVRPPPFPGGLKQPEANVRLVKTDPILALDESLLF